MCVCVWVCLCYASLRCNNNAAFSSAVFEAQCLSSVELSRGANFVMGPGVEIARIIMFRRPGVVTEAVGMAVISDSG